MSTSGGRGDGDVDGPMASGALGVDGRAPERPELIRGGAASAGASTSGSGAQLAGEVRDARRRIDGAHAATSGCRRWAAPARPARRRGRSDGRLRRVEADAGRSRCRVASATRARPSSGPVRHARHELVERDRPRAVVGPRTGTRAAQSAGGAVSAVTSPLPDDRRRERAGDDRRGVGQRGAVGRLGEAQHQPGVDVGGQRRRVDVHVAAGRLGAEVGGDVEPVGLGDERRHRARCGSSACTSTGPSAPRGPDGDRTRRRPAPGRAGETLHQYADRTRPEGRTSSSPITKTGQRHLDDAVDRHDVADDPLGDAEDDAGGDGAADARQPADQRGGDAAQQQRRHEERR